MNYRQALITSMKTFGVKASDVCARAEIDEAQFSKFRNERTGINLATWENITNGLPEEARAYLYFLLATKP